MDDESEERVNKRKILFLAANPLDTGRIRLEAEAREVEEGLRRASQREDFSFDCKFAVRVRDLRRNLLESPEIVHFSGHGSGVDGIVLEDEQGASVMVATEALANLFALHQGTVRCVVLNACFSVEQAEAIVQHISYVIGMSNAMDDESALAFSLGFYDALGAGRSIEEAFHHGRNAIELQALPGHDLPVLKKGPNAGELEPEGRANDVVGGNLDGQQNTAESRYRVLLEDLRAIGVETTRLVQCIGMHEAVPFDQIYQPTKLLFRSGLSIAASAAFGGQNRMAQSIAVSRAQELHSLTVEEFLNLPENAVIFAGPGWGKTTFLHHIFRRKLADNSVRTVLITLRRDSALSNLEELVTFLLSAEGRAEPRSLLLVDGYDEVSLAGRKRVSECLLRFAAGKRGRFILTCRDHYHVIGLAASQVWIDGFDKHDRYRFVAAFLSGLGSRLDATSMVNDLEGRGMPGDFCTS